MDDEAVRRLMRQAMDGDEPGLGPLLIGGAVSAARRIRRRRRLTSAGAAVVAPGLVVVLLATGALTPGQGGGGHGPAAARFAARTAYVANYGSSSVTPISIATNKAGKAIRVI